MTETIALSILATFFVFILVSGFLSTWRYVEGIKAESNVLSSTIESGGFIVLKNKCLFHKGYEWVKLKCVNKTLYEDLGIPSPRKTREDYEREDVKISFSLLDVLGYEQVIIEGYEEEEFVLARVYNGSPAVTEYVLKVSFDSFDRDVREALENLKKMFELKK